MTDVVVLVRPSETVALVEICGATLPIVGSAAIASLSSTVSVEVDPPPPFGLMVSRFVPRPASRLVMFDVVPWPTPTRATTEATPMITPSIVSAARSRLVRSRENESRRSSRRLMRGSGRHAGGPAGWRPARPRRRG